MALLCSLAWQIFQLAQSLALEIQVHHILGKWNVLADSLLRRSPVQTEWALDHIVFQAMVANFGLSPVIDLLATLLNSQLPVFISPFPDLVTFSVDTRDGVCLSPMALVHVMLMKLHQVHHYRPQVLALTAWYLSGVPSGAKVFQQQWLSTSAA